ncbi:MAG: LytR C-terminal domain-containing protein [Acidimicrobiales bacterium]
MSFDLYGAAELVERVEAEMANLGFTVDERYAYAASETASVVVYPTGQRSAAETTARYLLPTPRLVEDPDASAISVVLGQSHEQVLFLYPRDVAEMRTQAAAQLETGIPDLSTAVAVTTSDVGATTAAPTTAAPVTTASPATTEPAPLTTTDIEPADSAPPATEAVPTTTAGTIGRAPEGESCG